MSRLSNCDVDDLIQNEWEEALIEDQPWASDALRYREWASLDSKRVRCESDDEATVEGIWEWHGQTGDDFFLVYINDDDGNLIVGTDPRNFDRVSLVAGQGDADA